MPLPSSRPLCSVLNVCSLGKPSFNYPGLWERPPMEEGLRHRGRPSRPRDPPTLLLLLSWRKKAVWPHLRSESPFSPGGGMGLVFASVHACAHWRGEMYGEGPGAPTSLSNSVHRGPPAPRIVPSGVSLPAWSPSGLLTFLKACCWISDSLWM